MWQKWGWSFKGIDENSGMNERFFFSLSDDYTKIKFCWIYVYLNKKTEWLFDFVHRCSTLRLDIYTENN